MYARRPPLVAPCLPFSWNPPTVQKRRRVSKFRTRSDDTNEPINNLPAVSALVQHQPPLTPCNLGASFLRSPSCGKRHRKKGHCKMLSRTLILSLLPTLLVSAQDDGSISGATSSSAAAGYSCDASKCKLPSCNCASTSPPGGLNAVRLFSPSPFYAPDANGFFL
jgi:hypothetical protein